MINSTQQKIETAVKELPVSGRTFLVEGNAAFLMLPDQPADKRPWVWYTPTLPGLPGTEEIWMFNQFLQAGMAIAGIDVGESFGNCHGRARYTTFHQLLNQAYGLFHRACLLARSRGGLMLFNWAAEHPSAVACIAGIYPVCNLNSYPGLDKVSVAYGISQEQLTAELSQHNPVDCSTGLATEKVPILLIHDDNDKVVPLEENSNRLAYCYRKLGGEAELVVALRTRGTICGLDFFSVNS